MPHVDRCVYMNSMNTSFAGGVIRETDYFDSADRDQGLAWLVIHDHAWHVLLPDRCARRPREAYARPVIAHDEPDGWRWRLELGDWHLPLPTAQIIGPRPPLPEPRSRSARTLTLYSNELHKSRGQSFFGTMQPGIQIEGICELFLVREVGVQRRQGSA